MIFVWARFSSSILFESDLQAEQVSGAYRSFSDASTRASTMPPVRISKEVSTQTDNLLAESVGGSPMKLSDESDAQARVQVLIGSVIHRYPTKKILSLGADWGPAGHRGVHRNIVSLLRDVLISRVYEF